jgi:hypothetical protein|nr:MAG TPA: Repressor protein CI [Caudoviricetes sp.]
MDDILSLYKNIKAKRQELGLSQEELAKKVGYRDRTSIAKIETGKVDLSQSKIIEFANILGVTPSCLMGWDETTDKPKTKVKAVKIPVLGRVAAGVPIEMIEDVLDYEEITEDMAKHGEYFALKIQGDSMSPRIWNNDVVIVKQQDDAENGDIVIAAINGDDAVCKRLQKYSDGIALVSLNPQYEPIYLKKDEVDGKPVRILGKVVELRGKF